MKIMKLCGFKYLLNVFVCLRLMRSLETISGGKLFPLYILQSQYHKVYAYDFKQDRFYFIYFREKKRSQNYLWKS